jgi:hypothetical protein
MVALKSRVIPVLPEKAGGAFFKKAIFREFMKIVKLRVILVLPNLVFLKITKFNG